MARMTYHEARALASCFCFDPREDWHRMSTGSKEGVIAAAKSRGYRAPKNANGSTGRYFAEYLRRVIERGPSA